MKEEYSDRHEEVRTEILSTTRFNEKSDLSTTYLGKASINKDNKIAAEEKFPISEQVYTTGKLLDGTECQMLLDTTASKSFISKSHSLHCKSLHSLPKFASKTQIPYTKYTNIPNTIKKEKKVEMGKYYG